MRAEDVRRAYREGQRVTGTLASVYVRRTGLPVSRVGVAVSGRFGPAVSRNRLRRRLREAYRQLGVTAVAGVDLVIVPRSAALRASFAALQEGLRRMVVQAGVAAPPKAQLGNGGERQ